MQLIRDIMDMAVTDQLSVLRTFAFATDAPYALQTSPGVFHEDVFRGLDYVLDQARQRGLKVRAVGSTMSAVVAAAKVS